jgi:hypothetical protein
LAPAGLKDLVKAALFVVNNAPHFPGQLLTGKGCMQGGLR